MQKDKHKEQYIKVHRSGNETSYAAYKTLYYFGLTSPSKLQQLVGSAP
jgi:hypothetical protein